SAAMGAGWGKATIVRGDMVKTRTAARAPAANTGTLPARPRRCRVSSTARTRFARSARLAMASSGGLAVLEKRWALPTVVHDIALVHLQAIDAAIDLGGNQDLVRDDQSIHSVAGARLGGRCEREELSVHEEIRYARADNDRDEYETAYTIHLA